MSRSLLSCLVAFGLLSPVAAADRDAVQLVDEAIAAHGGAAALQAWSNVSLEGVLTVFLGDTEVTGRGERCVRDGAWLKSEAALEFRGSQFLMEEAATGDSGWRRRRGRVYDFPPDNARAWLMHRPDMLLRAADEPERLSRVQGADAMAVVEFRETEGTTRILLDPESGLVRALEYATLRNDGLGVRENAFVKNVYDDYRPVDGVPFPHLREEYTDGALDSRFVVDSVVLGRAPEASLFARPSQDQSVLDWGDQLAD